MCTKMKSLSLGIIRITVGTYRSTIIVLMKVQSETRYIGKGKAYQPKGSDGTLQDRGKL